jgi:hypothetical protein
MTSPPVTQVRVPLYHVPLAQRSAFCTATVNSRPTALNNHHLLRQRRRSKYKSRVAHDRDSLRSEIPQSCTPFPSNASPFLPTEATTKSPQCGSPSYELDILWVFFPGADPAKLLEKHGSRLQLLHLKDLRRGVKGDLSSKTAVENDVALRAGQLDLPGILKAAKKAGVKHYYIEDESPNTATQGPLSLAYLKGLKQ